MPSESKIDGRFVHLETKIAYQEKLVSELNEVLLSHTKAIDRLELRLVQLEGMLRDHGGEPLGHEPPPHY